jgi:hypothetical protein
MTAIVFTFENSFRTNSQRRPRRIKYLAARRGNGIEKKVMKTIISLKTISSLIGLSTVLVTSHAFAREWVLLDSDKAPQNWQITSHRRHRLWSHQRSVDRFRHRTGMELAADKIRVNTVSPGTVDSPMLHRLLV